MHNTNIKNLLGKLRSPLPLEFISKNILEVSKEEAEEILNQLINKNVVEKTSDNYKLKNNYGKH